MNELFQIPKEADAKKTQTKFIRFLKDKLTGLSGETNEVLKTSYEIAGLLATDYARTLSTTDTIDEILTIAGELETNPNNFEALRSELIKKIQSL